MESNTLVSIDIVLACICMALMVVIAFMINGGSHVTEEIKKEVQGIDKKCPKCPNCELKCPNNQSCPACPKSRECPDIETKQCPKCPDNNIICPTCPTVDDIVSGIYPGRNPDVVSEGKYYPVEAENIYDGLSTSNFYDQNYKFPMDKVLAPGSMELNDYNIDSNKINNSIENTNINSSKSNLLPLNPGGNNPSERLPPTTPTPSTASTAPTAAEGRKDSSMKRGTELLRQNFDKLAGKMSN